MKDLMMNVLSKFFNKTEDELSDMLFEGEGDEIKLKEDAATSLIGLDEARVKRIKEESSGDSTKKFDEGYKKAQKEVMSKFENDFKESMGFESDLNGVDLVKAWGEGLGKQTKITADNLKTHPEFLKIEKEWKTSHEEELGKIKTEFDSFKSNVEREKVMGKVRDMAKNEFLKLNPVLSEDKGKAEAQTSMFLSKFDNYDYDFQDDGSVVIKDGDKRLEDAHGNTIGFGSFVKTEADRLFDFKVQGDRGSPGNVTGASGGSTTVLSSEEYNKKVREANGDPAKLKDIGENYTRKAD